MAELKDKILIVDDEIASRDEYRLYSRISMKFWKRTQTKV